MEIVAQRKWPDRWGFFAETYKQVNVLNRLSRSWKCFSWSLPITDISYYVIQLEDGLEEIGDEIPPNTKVTDTTADLATRAFEIYDFKPEESGKNPKEKFPVTDSKHIGWRLDFKAPISQYILKSTGKKDLLRQLQWPAESL